MGHDKSKQGADEMHRAINSGMINWPTVLASAGVAAVVAAIILSIGIVGLSRNAQSQGQQSTIIIPNAESTTKSALPSSGKTANPSEPKAAAGSRGAPSTVTATAGSAEPVSPATGRATDAGKEAAAQQPSPAEDSTAGAPAGKAPTNATPLENTESTDNSELITSDNPTAEELGRIVSFLTATDAPDEAKAQLLETPEAVIVPKTISRIGFFRSPKGGSQVNGPVRVRGNKATAHLEAYSAGIPNVSIPIAFVKKDGSWRLSAESVCRGVKTLGLPIYCNS